MENQLNLKIRLFNSEFILINEFEYSNAIIKLGYFNRVLFTFSSDGHCFGVLLDATFLGLAYFPQGFEHDLFIQPSIGKKAFDEMFKNMGLYGRLSLNIESDLIR